MTIKCSVFIATSLDGFIARKDGELDWLPGSDGSTGGEDLGYEQFIATVDTLVMGRNTYELVLSFGAWPYPDKRVVVLSARYSGELRPLAEGVEGTSLSPPELVDRLARRGARHLYVDGGKTIQSFLKAGLIDEMTITRVPVLIGDGIPLFGSLEGDIRLLHRSTRAYESGMVQSRYEVASR
ncbi:MAG TPA: dihydrofolate reductase family protein [Sideroxyarcus sp.]|nr:dihydrofolate reductase family protein [Sideroxyarcus sp.]